MSSAAAQPRFWQEARAEPSAEGVRILLDGQPVRTPAKAELVVPAALGAELAAEWNAVGKVIRPAAMPLTRLVNSTIDGVVGRESEVVADIAAYAGTDLTLYRAEAPPDLAAAQEAAWGPVVAWAEARYDVRFIATVGLAHMAQPPASLARIAAAAATLRPFPLAGLHAMTTLTGSALIALAVAEALLTAEAAWAAAHADEDFQWARWGIDAEAAARRAAREAEFRAALRLVQAG